MRVIIIDMNDKAYAFMGVSNVMITENKYLTLHFQKNMMMDSIRFMMRSIKTLSTVGRAYDEEGE